MEKTYFKKALIESLGKSQEVLEEAVGKASFDNLLSNEEISKMGKVLKGMNVSLNQLVFKKKPAKTFTFSRSRERFLNKVQGYYNAAHVVVFIEPETKRFVTAIIRDFDKRSTDNLHFILTTNLDLVANINPLKGRSVENFGFQDLTELQTLINGKNTIIFSADVTHDNEETTHRQQQDRKYSQNTYDDIVRNAERYQKKVNHHLYEKRPVFKNLSKVLEEAGYKLYSLDATKMKDGNYYVNVFIDNQNRYGSMRFSFSRKNRCYSLDETIFYDFEIVANFSNRNAESGALKVAKIAEAIEMMRKITVKDILVETEEK